MCGRLLSFWHSIYPSCQNHGSVENGSLQRQFSFHLRWVFPLNHDYGRKGNNKHLMFQSCLAFMESSNLLERRSAHPPQRNSVFLIPKRICRKPSHDMNRLKHRVFVQKNCRVGKQSFDVGMEQSGRCEILQDVSLRECNPSKGLSAFISLFSSCKMSKIVLEHCSCCI